MHALLAPAPSILYCIGLGHSIYRARASDSRNVQVCKRIVRAVLPVKRSDGIAIPGLNYVRGPRYTISVRYFLRILIAILISTPLISATLAEQDVFAEGFAEAKEQGQTWCVVHLQHLAVMARLLCGHRCGCSQRFDGGALRGVCPMCRAPIEKAVGVFDS